ncbi:MAG: universal stress protein [Acidimicrobiales bacterium]|jgi:nucleotide-binding universal stress UspA family protein|nr:universal stress protein [Acidimicrobiales bacterium]
MGAAPTGPVIGCTDGSELAVAALGAGLALLPAEVPVVLVTVVAEPDPALVTGSGHAGGVLSPQDYARERAEAHAQGKAVLDAAARALGRHDAQHRVLEGSAGTAICALAEELDARAVVLGSRGRGGLRRAVLGSVSDHVVRRAPCPVLVVNDRVVVDDG